MRRPPTLHRQGPGAGGERPADDLGEHRIATGLRLGGEVGQVAGEASGGRTGVLRRVGADGEGEVAEPVFPDVDMDLRRARRSPVSVVGQRLHLLLGQLHLLLAARYRVGKQTEEQLSVVIVQVGAGTDRVLRLRRPDPGGRVDGVQQRDHAVRPVRLPELRRPGAQWWGAVADAPEHVDGPRRLSPHRRRQAELGVGDGVAGQGPGAGVDSVGRPAGRAKEEKAFGGTGRVLVCVGEQGAQGKEVAAKSGGRRKLHGEVGERVVGEVGGQEVGQEQAGANQRDDRGPYVGGVGTGPAIEGGADDSPGRGTVDPVALPQQPGGHLGHSGRAELRRAVRPRVLGLQHVAAMQRGRVGEEAEVVEHVGQVEASVRDGREPGRAGERGAVVLLAQGQERVSRGQAGGGTGGPDAVRGGPGARP
ncbi:hypothetical protein OHV13_03660 [Kitasatospora purpeofusca]